MKNSACLRNRPCLALGLALAFILPACGGGGNTRPVAPPPPPSGGTSPPPVEEPPPPPPPSVCEDPRAENTGGPMPCIYAYTDFRDNLLVATNVALAQAKGFTGQGVKVGLIGHVQDAEPNEFAKENMDGVFGDKIAFYQDFMDVPPLTQVERTKGLASTSVASIIMGSKYDRIWNGNVQGSYSGGIAPDAQLYWGGNCNAVECQFPAMQEAANALAEQGVRLFYLAQRMGTFGIGRGGPERAARDYAEALESTLANDPLIVVSAGDDTWFSEAGPGPHVPQYFPEFSDHWLVGRSVYIHEKEGLPYTESDAPWKTAACGSMMYWCIAAPNLIYEPFFSPRGNSGGTSYNEITIRSASVITGVAALVWEAYPWMSASNVQQTVLTTATDIGEPGVDPAWGWGRRPGAVHQQCRDGACWFCCQI